MYLNYFRNFVNPVPEKNIAHVCYIKLQCQLSQPNGLSVQKWQADKYGRREWSYNDRRTHDSFTIVSYSFTWRISLLVPDPALVDERPGRPPLLVREFLPGGGNASPNFTLEKFELVVRVYAHQLRVEASTGAWRVVVVQVVLSARVHHEQVLSTSVRQPLIYQHRCVQVKVHIVDRVGVACFDLGLLGCFNPLTPTVAIWV